MTTPLRHAGARRPLARIFAAPALLALLSLAGLVTALIGDGGYDLFAWLALGAPVAAFLWAMRARRR